MVNIIRSETFTEIDSLQHLKISSKPILRTRQKSALQHSLFSRYADFFKIMRTIHTSMTSTFYFEFIVSFERKTLTILTFKCTSQGGICAHYLGKINTKLQVSSVEFSVAGLDRAKLGVYQFQRFLFIVVIVISILLKPIVNHW